MEDSPEKKYSRCVVLGDKLADDMFHYFKNFKNKKYTPEWMETENFNFGEILYYSKWKSYNRETLSRIFANVSSKLDKYKALLNLKEYEPVWEFILACTDFHETVVKPHLESME